MKYYTGIGARKTPKEILELMNRIALELNKYDYTLRSGGANGADTAFEQGAYNKEIYLPWKGFNGNESPLYTIPEKAFEIAGQYRVNFLEYKQSIQKLFARNVQQILGKDLNTPSRFVVCWTPEGKMVGGTSLALSVAEDYGVPIINLATQDSKEIRRYL